MVRPFNTLPAPSCTCMIAPQASNWRFSTIVLVVVYFTNRIINTFKIIKIIITIENILAYLVLRFIYFEVSSYEHIISA